jgi:hypothetical protein
MYTHNSKGIRRELKIRKDGLYMYFVDKKRMTIKPSTIFNREARLHGKYDDRINLSPLEPFNDVFKKLLSKYEVDQYGIIFHIDKPETQIKNHDGVYLLWNNRIRLNGKYCRAIVLHYEETGHLVDKTKIIFKDYKDELITRDSFTVKEYERDWHPFIIRTSEKNFSTIVLGLALRVSKYINSTYDKYDLYDIKTGENHTKEREGDDIKFYFSYGLKSKRKVGTLMLSQILNGNTTVKEL